MYFHFCAFDEADPVVPVVEDVAPAMEIPPTALSQERALKGTSVVFIVVRREGLAIEPRHVVFCQGVNEYTSNSIIVIMVMMTTTMMIMMMMMMMIMMMM